MGNKSAKKSFGGDSTSPTKEAINPALVPLHLANLDCISKEKFCSVVSIFGDLDDCDCWPSESRMEHAVLHFETTMQGREFMKFIEEDKVGKFWKLRIPDLSELEDRETFFLREQVKLLQKKKFQLQKEVQDRERKLHIKIDEHMSKKSFSDASCSQNLPEIPTAIGVPPSPRQGGRSRSPYTYPIQSQSADEVMRKMSQESGGDDSRASRSTAASALDKDESQVKKIEEPITITRESPVREVRQKKRTPMDSKRLQGRKSNNTLYDIRQAKKIQVQNSKKLRRARSEPHKGRKQERLMPFYNKKKSKKRRRGSIVSSTSSVVSTWTGKNTSSRAALFRVFDPDRNGKIVPKDFQKGLAKHGVVFNESSWQIEFSCLWAFFDIAQKGWITYRDFQQLVVPDMELEGFLNLCRALSQENPEQFLDHSDLKIRKQVHKKLVSQIRNETRFQMLQEAENTWELFNSMDVYKKGYVSFAEFEKVMAATAIFEISKEEEHALFDFICPRKEMTFRLEDLETIVGHDASADMFRFWAEEHIHQRRSYEEQTHVESQFHYGTSKYFSRTHRSPANPSATSESYQMSRDVRGEDVHTEDLSF